MTEINIKKVALLFALFAFILLALGSWVQGARIVTAFIRGIEGFAIFGLLAWGVGKRLLAQSLLNEYEPPPPSTDEEEDKGEKVDQTV